MENDESIDKTDASIDNIDENIENADECPSDSIILTVDRREGDIWVCVGENGLTVGVRADSAPQDITEGDVVNAVCENGETRIISRNSGETEERRRRITSLFEKLRNK